MNWWKKFISRIKRFFKKNYILIFIDLISLAMLITGICFDVNYREELNNFLALLSVDSLLSIVAIAASIVLPFNQTKIIEKYGINEDEYKQYRGASNNVYINILYASIILLIADAVFYVFKLPISLIVSFAVLVFMACYMLIPRFRDWLRKDAGLYKIARKKLEKIVKANDHWENTIIIDSSVNARVTNKIVVYSILNNDFDFIKKTFFGFGSSIIEDRYNDSHLVIYVANLLHDGMLKYDKNETPYGELDEKKMLHYLDAIEKTLNLLNKTDFDNSWTEIRQNTLVEYIETVCLISKIVSSKDKYNAVLDEFYDFVIKIARDSENKNLKSFYYSLLDTLLYETMQNGTTLFVKAMLRYFTKYSFGLNYPFNDYFIFFMFYLLYIVNNQDNMLFLTETDKKDINDTTKFYFEKYMEKLDKEFDPDYFKTLINNLDDHYKRYTDFIQKQRNTLSLISFFMDVQNNLNDICHKYPFYFLTIYYKSENFAIDDYLYQLDSESLESLSWLYLFADLENYKDIYSFYETTDKLDIFRYPVSFDDVKKGVNYIHQYRERMARTDEIVKEIGFDKFITNFNKHFKSLSCYNESLESRKENLSSWDQRSYTYYFDLSNSSGIEKTLGFNKKKLYKEQFDFFNDSYAISYSYIPYYNPSIAKEIDSFEPTLKYSPVFDKYLNEETAVKCPNLKNTKSDFDYIFKDTNIEGFFKENAFAFRCHILNDKSYIRAADSFDINKALDTLFCKIPGKEHYIKLGTNTEYTLYEAQKYILSNVYVATFTIKRELVADNEKMLIYKIVGE